MDAVYCIVALSAEHQEAVATEVATQYPGSMPVADNVFLLTSGQSAEQIAVALGIRPESGSEPPRLGSGLVVSLNGSFSGYGATSLGNWLQAHG